MVGFLAPVEVMSYHLRESDVQQVPGRVAPWEPGVDAGADASGVEQVHAGETDRNDITPRERGDHGGQGHDEIEMAHAGRCASECACPASRSRRLELPKTNGFGACCRMASGSARW